MTNASCLVVFWCFIPSLFLLKIIRHLISFPFTFLSFPSASFHFLSVFLFFLSFPSLPLSFPCFPFSSFLFHSSLFAFHFSQPFLSHFSFLFFPPPFPISLVASCPILPHSVSTPFPSSPFPFPFSSFPPSHSPSFPVPFFFPFRFPSPPESSASGKHRHSVTLRHLSCYFRGVCA